MASADTPKRVYCRSNICVLCGFSFVQTEITSTGEEIVKKYFKEKLRLIDERVHKIQSVIEDFAVATGRDESNGVCLKCFRRVESVRKMRADIQTQETLLREGRQNVDKVFLTLPSPRKQKLSVKRLLRSPSVSQVQKQSKHEETFPTNVIRKYPVKLLPLPHWQYSPSKRHERVPMKSLQISEPEQQSTRPRSEVSAESMFSASSTSVSEPQSYTRGIYTQLEQKPVFSKSARKMLGFSEPDRQSGEVEVTVFYPSGKKTTLITSSLHKRMCMTIARGSNVEKVVALQLSSSSPMDVVNASANIIKEESQKLCKRGSGSVLLTKSHDDFFSFTLKDLQKELESSCPGMMAVLSSIVSDTMLSPTTKQYRHLLMAAAIGLHGRNQEMSMLQYLTGFILMHGGCTHANIERLVQIGLSVHPRTIHRKLLTWQGNLDSEILGLRDSWASGGSEKYQLIGDNWDKNILPSYRTSDRKTVSLHLFNMYAIVDRVRPLPSRGYAKILDATDLDASTFIPSEEEQVQLMEELIFIYASSVISNLPQLEKCYSDYPKHLKHQYSKQAGIKTTQYPLGLFDCNENLTQDIVPLLAHTLEKYVPMSDGEIVESVFLGGDRLTDERVQGAQKALKNAPTPKERLEGFVSKTEDFHRLMNFLEAITKMTYITKSGSDKGTAYYYRNLLNARGVKGHVRNSYRAYKILYYTILDSLCVLMFLNHFNIEDVDSDIPFPDGFHQKSHEDRLAWLNDTCREILRKWFFDNSMDVFRYLREVVVDMEHPENYWLANLEDGRVRCHHCNKTYAYVGSLMAHEKNVHNVKIEKPKSKSKRKDTDQLQDHTIMLFKLLMLHKNLDTAVDMGDGPRSVRSTKYELPIYNRTNKVKYTIGSIHLTALTSGILPSEQAERLVANRFVNLQGGKNSNIALDEYLEMLNRDSKLACSGYKTKESIISHSKEYPHLTNSLRHFDVISELKKRKGFHHLPSYRNDVMKVTKDLMQQEVLNSTPGRALQCKELVAERNPFDGSFHGLSTMIHRHKPTTPFRRLRDRHF